MKANFLLPSALCLALLSACAQQTPPPAPTPQPRPVETVAPAPQPAPRPIGDWRNAPLTPGRWTYTRVQEVPTHSPPSPPVFVAVFGSDRRTELFGIECQRAAGRIILLVPGKTSNAAVTITTTTAVSRPLTAALNASRGWLEVTLAPRDVILDQVAFSRGRFVVEVSGEATMYLPAWPEVSHVIEDCR